MEGRTEAQSLAPTKSRNLRENLQGRFKRLRNEKVTLLVPPSSENLRSYLARIQGMQASHVALRALRRDGLFAIHYALQSAALCKALFRAGRFTRIAS